MMSLAMMIFPVSCKNAARKSLSAFARSIWAYHFCSLTEPDIRGVITALENVIQNKLSSSRIVRMERLGSFYPAISSNGEEEESKVDANSIKKVSVNYRPGDRITKAINDAGFRKVGSTAKSVTPEPKA